MVPDAEDTWLDRQFIEFQASASHCFAEDIWYAINPGPLSISRLYPDDVRSDGKCHLIVKGGTDRRCKMCGKKTLYRFKKFDIGLHAVCFEEYHVQ
jgi:hypothetical protein